MEQVLVVHQLLQKIARDLGALTVGVVTSPFTFEGPRRKRQAFAGLEELRKNVDSIIVVSNDRLLEVIGNRPMNEAFREADNILRQSVQTITDLIAIPAMINLDFADVSSVMKDRGDALIGIGMAEGENKAQEAAKRLCIISIIRCIYQRCKGCNRQHYWWTKHVII